MAKSNYDLYLENLKKKYGESSHQQQNNPNFFEKIGATVNDVKNSVAQGVFKGLEGIVDAGAGIIAGAGNALGADTTELEKFIKFNYSDALINGNEWYSDIYRGVTLATDSLLNPTKLLPNIIDFSKNINEGKDFIQSYNDTAKKSISSEASFLNDLGTTNLGPIELNWNEIAHGTLQSIGQMLPSIAVAGVTGGAGIASNITFGVGAGGTSVEESLNEGKDIGTALAYGTAEGAKEVFTEWLGGKLFDSKFAGVSSFKSGAKNASKLLETDLTKVVSEGSVKSLLKGIAKEGFGEGMEEVIGDAIDPIIKKFITDKDGDLGEMYVDALKGMPASFVSGAMSGMIMGSPTTVSQVRQTSVKSFESTADLSEFTGQVLQARIRLEADTKISTEEKAKLDKQLTDKLSEARDRYQELIGDKVTDTMQQVLNDADYTASSSSSKVALEKGLNEALKKKGIQANIIVDSERNIKNAYKEANLKKITDAGRGFRGYTDDKGNIYIAQDTIKRSTRSIYQTVTHEIGHNLSDAQKKSLHKEMLSRASKSEGTLFKRGTKNVNKNNWQQVYSELYRDQIAGLSKEDALAKITEEFVNDYLSEDIKDFASLTKALKTDGFVRRLFSKKTSRDKIFNTVLKGLKENLKERQASTYEIREFAKLGSELGLSQEQINEFKEKYAKRNNVVSFERDSNFRPKQYTEEKLRKGVKYMSYQQAFTNKQEYDAVVKDLEKFYDEHKSEGIVNNYPTIVGNKVFFTDSGMYKEGVKFGVIEVQEHNFFDDKIYNEFLRGVYDERRRSFINSNKNIKGETISYDNSIKNYESLQKWRQDYNRQNPRLVKEGKHYRERVERQIEVESSLLRERNKLLKEIESIKSEGLNRMINLVEAYDMYKITYNESLMDYNIEDTFFETKGNYYFANENQMIDAIKELNRQSNNKVLELFKQKDKNGINFELADDEDIDLDDIEDLMEDFDLAYSYDSLIKDPFYNKNNLEGLGYKQEYKGKRIPDYAVDNLGNKLTPIMRATMRDSYVRNDESLDAPLRVVYHTTGNGGFNVMNPNLDKTDSGNYKYKTRNTVVNFYSDSPDISRTYGEDSTLEPQTSKEILSFNNMKRDVRNAYAKLFGLNKYDELDKAYEYLLSPEKLRNEIVESQASIKEVKILKDVFGKNSISLSEIGDKLIEDFNVSFKEENRQYNFEIVGKNSQRTYHVFAESTRNNNEILDLKDAHEDVDAYYYYETKVKDKLDKAKKYLEGYKIPTFEQIEKNINKIISKTGYEFRLGEYNENIDMVHVLLKHNDSILSNNYIPTGNIINDIFSHMEAIELNRGAFQKNIKMYGGYLSMKKPLIVYGYSNWNDIHMFEEISDYEPINQLLLSSEKDLKDTILKLQKEGKINLNEIKGLSIKDPTNKFTTTISSTDYERITKFKKEYGRYPELHDEMWSDLTGEVWDFSDLNEINGEIKKGSYSYEINADLKHNNKSLFWYTSSVPFNEMTNKDFQKIKQMIISNATLSNSNHYDIYSYSTNGITMSLLDYNETLPESERYDGVIFKNIKDISNASVFVGENKYSNVYVTINNSNQFKAIDNKNPNMDDERLDFELSDEEITTYDQLFEEDMKSIDKKISKYEDLEGQPSKRSEKAKEISIAYSNLITDILDNEVQELKDDLEEHKKNNNKKAYEETISKMEKLYEYVEHLQTQAEEYLDYIDVESEWENPQDSWIDKIYERQDEAQEYLDEIDLYEFESAISDAKDDLKDFKEEVKEEPKVEEKAPSTPINDLSKSKFARLTGNISEIGSTSEVDKQKIKVGQLIADNASQEEFDREFARLRYMFYDDVVNNRHINLPGVNATTIQMLKSKLETTTEAKQDVKKFEEPIKEGNSSVKDNVWTSKEKKETVTISNKKPFDKKKKLSFTKWNNGETVLYTNNGEAIVQVNVGDKSFNFYCSAGKNAKLGVEKGKWYAIFGVGIGWVGENKTFGISWINKGTSGEQRSDGKFYDKNNNEIHERTVIGNYYGSEALRDISQFLDSELGDMSNKYDHTTLKESITADYRDMYNLNNGFNIVKLSDSTNQEWSKHNWGMIDEFDKAYGVKEQQVKQGDFNKIRTKYYNTYANNVIPQLEKSKIDKRFLSIYDTSLEGFLKKGNKLNYSKTKELYDNLNGILEDNKTKMQSKLEEIKTLEERSKELSRRENGKYVGLIADAKEELDLKRVEKNSLDANRKTLKNELSELKKDKDNLEVNKDKIAELEEDIKFYDSKIIEASKEFEQAKTKYNDLVKEKDSIDGYEGEDDEHIAGKIEDLKEELVLKESRYIDNLDLSEIKYGEEAIEESDKIAMEDYLANKLNYLEISKAVDKLKENLDKLPAEVEKESKDSIKSVEEKLKLEKKEITDVKPKKESKPKEKKVNVKNTVEVKEVIKEIVKERVIDFTRTRKQSETSAQTVKNYADVHNAKVYNLGASSKIITLVDSILDGGSGNSRIMFEGGREIVEQRMFEALNLYGNYKGMNQEQVVKAIADLVLSGVEVKTMKNGKYVFTKYSDIEDAKLKSRVEKTVNNSISKIMESEGREAKIAREINKLYNDFASDILEYQEAIKKLNEEKAEIARELKELNEDLTDFKNNNQMNEDQVTEYKEIVISMAEELVELKATDKAKIDKLQNTIKELRSKINQLNKVKNSVNTLENKLASEKTKSTEGKVVTTRAKNEIQRMINQAFDSEVVIDSNLDSIYEKLSQGDFEGSANEVMRSICSQEEIDEMILQNDYDMVRDVIRDSLEEIYDRAKPTKLKNALDRIESLKAKYKESKAVAQKVQSLKNLEKNIKEKITKKKKGKGVNPKFVDSLMTLVSLSKSDLLKGKHRELIRDFLNDYDSSGVKEVAEMPEQLYNDLKEIASLDTEVTSTELKRYKDLLSLGIAKYLDTLSGKRSIRTYSNGKLGNVQLSEASKSSIEDRKSMTDKRLKKAKMNKSKSALLQTVSPRVAMVMFDGGIDSTFRNMIYDALVEANIEFKKKHMELMKPFEEFKKGNKKFLTGLAKEKITVGKITATKGELVTLYLTSLDEGGMKHLVNSGIDINGEKVTFKQDVETVDMLDEDGNQVVYKKDVYDKDGNLIHKIGEVKTTERVYSKELNDLLKEVKNTLEVESGVMSEYIGLIKGLLEEGKNIKKTKDEAILGYSNVIDGFYFPLHIDEASYNTNIGSNSKTNNKDIQGVTNRGYDKDRTSTVGIVKLYNVDDIVTGLSMRYAQDYGYSEVVDGINQIFNYRNEDGESLGSIAKDQIGKTQDGTYILDDYINKLLRDVQGIGNYNDLLGKGTSKFVSTLMRRFSTFQLGANPKVAMSQITSIFMALKHISVGNLIKGFGYKTNAPLPPLAQYRAWANQYVTAETLNGKISKAGKFFTKANQLMDGLAIKWIWRASLAQCNGDVEKATALFNKTVAETQPNGDSIGKSSLQRSDKEVVKMLMMFKSQPTQNWSNMIEAMVTGKGIPAILGMIAVSGLAYTAIAEMFKHFLQRDDEPEDAVDWFIDWVNNALLGMLPIISNTFSIDRDKGLKVNDFELGAMNQLVSVFENVQGMFNEEPIERKVKRVSDSVGMLSGIPTSNLYKYSIAPLKWLPTTSEGAIALDLKFNGYSATLNKAKDYIESGKESRAKSYYNIHNNEIMTLQQSTLDAMFNLYKENKTTALKGIPSKFTVDGEDIQIDKNKFKATYSKVSTKLNSLVNRYEYKKASSEVKKTAVNKLINGYYNIARKEQTKEELSKFEMLLNSRYTRVSDLALYVSEIQYMEASKNKTRKEVVQQYINKLRLSANEKYILYLLSGYSIPDSKKSSVSSYLKTLGLSKENINKLLS